MREMEALLDKELRSKVIEELQIRDFYGDHVGLVDRLEGDRIRLVKTSEMKGKHHYIKLDDVRSVDDVAIYLKKARSEMHF